MRTVDKQVFLECSEDLTQKAKNVKLVACREALDVM